MTSHARQILTEELSLCFDEGFRAFVKRAGKQYDNPYRNASRQHAAYRAGWGYGDQTLAHGVPAGMRGKAPGPVPRH